MSWILNIWIEGIFVIDNLIIDLRKQIAKNFQNFKQKVDTENRETFFAVFIIFFPSFLLNFKTS